MFQVRAGHGVNGIERRRAFLSHGQYQLPERIARILLEHNQMAENIAKMIQQIPSRFSAGVLGKSRHAEIIRRAARIGREEGTGGIGIGVASGDGRRRGKYLSGRGDFLVVRVFGKAVHRIHLYLLDVVQFRSAAGEAV